MCDSLEFFPFQENLNGTFTYPSSCEEYFQQGSRLNGTYFIRPNQESQKIFKAALPMDATQVKTKLIGYGFSLLEGIDPNPEVIIFNHNAS